MEGKLNIKFQLQHNPVVGANVYIARPEIYSTIGLDAIVAYASKAAGISQSDMYVTLEALYDAFSYFLCNGHSFVLDGVGTFSLSIGTKASDATLDGIKVGADAVERVGINFLPAKELKVLLDNLSFETTAMNENHLVEIGATIGTSLKVGAYSTQLNPLDGSKAVAGMAGDIVTLRGYNFAENVSLVITGKMGEENVSETINMQLLSKKTRIEVQGRLTKSYDIINTVKVMVGEVQVALYDWTGAPIPTKTVAYIGGIKVTEGGNYSAANSALTVRGANGQVVTLDGEQIEPMEVNGTLSTYRNSIGEGAHVLVVGPNTYNINITAAKIPNITMLSANGVTVASGGSSGVRAGQSYSFVANGQNTDLVKIQDITVPMGSVISNFSATSTQVKFTLTMGTEGGLIRVANYACTLVMGGGSADDPRVDRCDRIAAGGTLTMSGNGSEKLTFTGANLKNLNVLCTNSAVTISQQTASMDGTTLTVQVKAGSTTQTGSIVVRDANGTTYWNCNVSVSGSGMDFEG